MTLSGKTWAAGEALGSEHRTDHNNIVGALNNRGIDVTLPPYNAAGDGVADDTAAIQAALDTGEPVFMPPSYIFGISDPLTMANEFQRFTGTGWGTKIKALSAMDAMLVMGTTAGNAYRSTVGGFELDGNSQAQHGLVLADAGGNTRLTVAVRNCLSHGFLFDLSYGGVTGNNNNMHLDGCQSAVNGGAGFAVPTLQGDNNTIRFSGCWSTGNSGAGYLWKGRGSTFLTCLAENNGGYGVQFGETGDASPLTVNNVLMNCWLEANTLGGIVTHQALRNAFLYGAGQRWDQVNSTAMANVELVMNSNIDGYWDFVGRIRHDGVLEHIGTHVGFYDVAPVTQPDITGSKGGNAALASLVSALASLGLITDSTT